MEHVGKNWRRSEGKLRTLGRENQQKGRKLHAYRPAEREKPQEKKPNEMMRMESSYGGISLGASRDRRMKMVVHETRRHNGPALEKDRQEVEGSRTASIAELRGDFKTNSHSRSKSAFVYEESMEETPHRMMERIQEMMDENNQQSAEQVLPFLNRKEDKRRSKEIQKELRENQEQENMAEYEVWNHRREDFAREQSEKKQMRQQFFRELSFAREKSRRLMRGEGLRLSAVEELLSRISEGTAAEDDDAAKKNEKKNLKK